MDRVPTWAVPYRVVLLVSLVVSIPYAIARQRGWIPESAWFALTLATVIVLASELAWRAYANRE